MGVVDDFKGTTIFCKVAFILLFIATLFTYISYTTTEWVYDDIGADALHYGLWRICGEAELPGACSHIDGWANGKFKDLFILFLNWKNMDISHIV